MASQVSKTAGVILKKALKQAASGGGASHGLLPMLP